MQSWPALPDIPLQPAGQIVADFIARGITDFRAAGRYLHHLPYGRNADRSDFRLVLPEGRGTCSTKHAFSESQRDCFVARAPRNDWLFPNLMPLERISIAFSSCHSRL